MEKIYQTLKTVLNISKSIKNTPLRVVFPTLFTVFGNVARHDLSVVFKNLLHVQSNMNARLAPRQTGWFHFIAADISVHTIS